MLTGWGVLIWCVEGVYPQDKSQISSKSTSSGGQTLEIVSRHTAFDVLFVGLLSHELGQFLVFFVAQFINEGPTVMVG